VQKILNPNYIFPPERERVEPSINLGKTQKKKGK
jgi:hypothetical protein